MTSDCESIVAIVRHMTIITTEAVLSFFLPAISLLQSSSYTQDYIDLLWSDILTNVYTYYVHSRVSYRIVSWEGELLMLAMGACTHRCTHLGFVDFVKL